MYKLLNGIDFYSANEVDERFSNESVIAERERAQAAEQTLQNNITDEQTRAEGAEQTLQNNINTELARASAAEQTLQNNIDNEQSRAEATEQNLDSRMTDWESKLNQTNNNVTAEVTRATEAEQANSDAIAAEVTRATKAEQANSDAIAAEVLRAQETERTINNALLSESQRAQATETAIDSALSTETTRATAAEQANTNAIDAEVTRATTAEQANTDAIAAEVNRATAAEQVNTDAIAAEVNRAKLAEQSLTSNVASEVNRAKLAEHTLTDKLTSEVNRATTAEQSLAQDVADEELRASQAEASITSSVTALGTRVTRLSTEISTNGQHQIMTFETVADLPSAPVIDASQLKITDGQLAYVKDTQVWYKATVNDTSDPVTVTWNKYKMSVATDKLEDYPYVVNPKPGQYRWLRFDPNNKRGLVIQKGVVINLSYFGVDAVLHVNEDLHFDMGSSLEGGINYYVVMTYTNDRIVLTAKSRIYVSSDDIIIGRFHTLCVSVGSNVTMHLRAPYNYNGSRITIKAYTEREDPDFYNFYTKKVLATVSNTTEYKCVTVDHPLSGYTTGNILPESIFCETFRPSSKYQMIRYNNNSLVAVIEDSMVYDKDSDKAIDIYLQSGTSTFTSSKYKQTFTVGRTPLLHSADMADVGKKLLTNFEFTCAAKGSNECTSIKESAMNSSAGGHSDTNDRRMISAIGCEDMCGLVNQWLDEFGLNTQSSVNWSNNADNSAKFGQTFGSIKVLCAGGSWEDDTKCGSLCRDSNEYYNTVHDHFGARGACTMIRGRA